MMCKTTIDCECQTDCDMCEACEIESLERGIESAMLRAEDEVQPDSD